MPLKLAIIACHRYSLATLHSSLGDDLLLELESLGTKVVHLEKIQDLVIDISSSHERDRTVVDPLALLPLTTLERLDTIWGQPVDNGNTPNNTHNDTHNDTHSSQRRHGGMQSNAASHNTSQGSVDTLSSAEDNGVQMKLPPSSMYSTLNNGEYGNQNKHPNNKHISSSMARQQQISPTVAVTSPPVLERAASSADSGSFGSTLGSGPAPQSLTPSGTDHGECLYVLFMYEDFCHEGCFSTSWAEWLM